MATRHEITSIQFKADAGKANAAIDSIRQSAKEAAEQLERVRNDLKAGEQANLPTDKIEELRDKVKAAKKDYDQWIAAQKSLLRGVKALDQAIIEFNRGRGSVEGMSAALSKAARNAAQLQQARSDRGSQTWHEMEALIIALDKNLLHAKQDMDGLIASLNAKESVSDSSLRNAAATLKELMDLSVRGSAEWLEYKSMLDTVSKATKDIALEERRLKGEIVDANAAREEAKKLTREGADAAKRMREEAEGNIAAAKQEIDALRQQRQVKKEAAAATAELVEQKNKEIAQQDELVAKMEKEAQAQRDKLEADRDKARSEEIDAQRLAATKQSLMEDEKRKTQELTGEVQNLKAEIASLNAEPIKPKVDTSEIERLTAEAKEAQRVLGNASAFEKLAQAKLEGMRSAHSRQETGFRSKEAELRKFTDATYELQERRNELDWAIEPFSRRHRKGYNHFDVHDVEQQRVAVEKLDEAFRRLHDDEYFKNAPLSRQYELLGTAAFGYSDAERQFGSYERAIRSLGVALEETGAKARLVFQGAGVDKSFQGVEFMEGYVTRRKEIAQLNADIKKALGDTDIDALAREVETERKIFNQGTEDIKEQEKEVERWGRLKQEYADKAAEAERNLAEATKQGTAATNEESEAAQKLADQIRRRKQDLEETIKDEQAANEELKRYGITTADVTDEVKLQAAAEKALKEEEETRLELAKQMLEVRKQVGAAELKDSRIVGTKETRAFYEKNKGILEDEWWKSEAGGGSVSRMYKYLNDISDDPEAKAEFQEQVGVSVKDAMRVAGQKMREVIQEAMKRGIKIDDAMTDFEDGYGHGPATSIAEFMKEFNETISEKEKELIDKRRKDLDTIYDAVYDPGEESEMPSRDERLKEIKSSLMAAADGHYGNGTPLSENIRQQREEIAGLEEEYNKLTKATEQSADADQKKADKQAELEQKEKALTEQRQKQAQAETDYEQAQAKADEATDKAVMAEQQLGTASDNTAKRLDEEKKKQQQLNSEREQTSELLEQQQQAVGQVDEKIVEQNQLMQDAEQKKQQAQELTIKRMEEMLAKLKEENYAETAAGTDTWKEKQKEIEDLEQKIRELKGEVMSLADAEEIANKAMQEQALTEKTGWAAGTEELQRAEKVLADKVAKAKRGTKEEEAAYQKLVRQLQAVRTEMQGGAVTGEKMMAVLKDPKAYTNIDTLKSAIGRARMELNALGERIDQAKMGKSNEDVRKLQKTYDQLAESIKNTDVRMKELQNSAKGTASAFDKAWSRLKTYIGLYMGAAVAIQKLTGTLGDLMELSDKMGEVRKTTGFTADEVGRLSENLKKMDVRTPLTQLMEVSAAAGQLGLKTLEDVQGFTEAANKLMIALPEMGKEAATEMMRVAIATGEVEKIRRQLQEGTIEGSSATAVAMEKIASTIDRLRATSASTAPEITDFVKRVGAVGAQSGITIDQVSALGSTISSLGLRIEMSATALSRMIPAIRNNAFDVARAIGVAPNTIRDLFDAGRGMEAILMVLQKMKDSKMDAESIEAMMGMGGMADIMKDLNQQGARAGIVFAGLSQNVDELRRQLGVASDAYEKNIAVQQEFDKMNATTAAKWERLKNQLEEAFVGDAPQRLLGTIIDGLRTIVDLLTGKVGPAMNFVMDVFKTFLVAWGTFKIGLGEGLFIKSIKGLRGLADTIKLMGMYTKETIVLKWQLIRATDEETKSALRAKLAQQGLNKTMLANIYMAAAAAIAYVAYRLWESAKAAKEAAAEMGRFNEKVAEERKALNELFDTLKKSNTAQDERLKLINEINSKYSKYLGYMLSETASAVQLANAHELIAKRIREEAYERRIMEKEKAIQEEHNEDVNAAYAKITERVRSGSTGRGDVQDMADMLKSIVDSNMKNIKYAYDNSNNIFSTKTRYYIDPKIKAAIDNGIERLVVDGKLSRDNVSLIQKAVYKYTVEAKSQHDDIMNQTSNVRSDLRNIQGAIKIDLANNLNNLVNNVITSANNIVRQMPGAVSSYLNRPQGGNGPKLPSLFGGQQQQQGGTSWQAPWQQPQQTAPQVESAPKGWKPNINKKDTAAVRQFVQDQDALRSGLNGYTGPNREAYESWLIPKEELETYRKIIEKADKAGSGGGNGGWGDKQGAESVNYKDMNAEQLVQRRKQMKDFVNAIQTDSDVKGVLAEDKALQKAIEKGMSSDMRTVIEWYNTERLKIQDELHARHLTNTGDWMDPKKQKNRHKQFKAEMQAYLEELDAYYTERKAEIERARNEEEMTEGEAWKKTIENDAEWHQRRAELQKMYSDKAVEVAEDEQNRIREIIAERTGDDVSYIQKNMEKTKQFAEMVRKADPRGEAEFRKWMADLGLGWEKDYLKQAQAVGKQVKFIEETLAKERPLNGIVEDLETTLAKMGILEGQVPEKMRVLLDVMENVYTTDVKELVDRISEAGFKEWARQIEGDTTMQQALLAQLRKAYDSVQDAIRKEASRIKKDADTMWKTILIPGVDANGRQTQVSLKQATDEALARMTQQQDSLGRANSLIGAGVASDNVATKLAIRQLKLQLDIQKAQFALMKKMGNEKADYLDKKAEELKLDGKLAEADRARRDAANVRKSLELAVTEETKKQEELNSQIAKEQEEAQARLYKSLREWADLLSSSLQSVMEASNAGNAEYYNELAKLNLTGKGGPGAGMYVVIDNSGTSDATAHYEYLNERQALERQREIEQQNAMAEALKKAWDDINAKINDMITDQINAMLQNASIDANTLELQNVQTELGNEQVKIDGNIEALGTNTDAMTTLTGAVNNLSGTIAGKSASEIPGSESIGENIGESTDANNPNATYGFGTDEYQNAYLEHFMGIQKASDNARKTVTENNKKITANTQSAFAKMTLAANLYGTAYQLMSNDNLDAAQKFQLFAVQAAGNAAIAMLTTNLATTEGQAAAELPGILGKAASQLGPIAGPIAFAAMSALLGGLMGLAVSKIAKSKSTIAQATGASVSAGRLATGMLTYASGNVNEMTDPSTLTPGRHYNVDGADGRTYRAKYMGKDAKTHITTGAEFHLVGEKGREAIIDAHTTRNIQMNDPEIWHTIQTLYNGGSMSRIRSRRGRGVRTFADGNLDDFEEMGSEIGTGDVTMDITGIKDSLDRNTAVQEALLERLSQPIQAKFDVYGKGGLVDSYDTGKKNVTRHGERY